MSEDMAITLARLEELTTTTPEGDPLDQPLRLFGYEVVATLVKHIRELEKRIGELAQRQRMSDVKQNREIVSGARYADFSNALSDVIHEALEKGMAVDEAVCIGAGVLADYARNEYGPEYLPRLASVIIERAREPMPADISRQ